MMKMLHATLLSLIITGIASVAAQAPVYITSAASSKCLTVKDFKAGTAVEIDDCIRSPAQQWVIDPDSSEVRVGGRNCLDAKTVNTGSPVVIWQCNGNPWQQWVFRNGGTLTLASNQNLCLDVPNSSNNNGVQVQTYACNGGRNQLWYSRPAF